MGLLKSGFAWSLSSAIALMLAIPFFAHADGIPSAIISASANGGPSISTVGTSNGSQCIPGSFCQNSLVSVFYVGGNAYVSGSGAMSCDGGGQFCNRSFEPFLPGGEASVTFSFSVIGSKSETVPLIFTGFGDATMFTGSEASSAFAYVNTPGGDFTACFIAGIPPCYYGSGREFVDERILGGFLKDDEFGLVTAMR